MGVLARVLAHDGAFWRRLAWLGAAHGPLWWMRYSPPAFGVAAALAVPRARRAVVDNLRRVRGHVPALRETLDVAQTFVAYAGCLSEALASGSKNAAIPDLLVHGEEHVREAVARGGIIMVTAHTAGWEATGPQLSRDLRLRIMLVMEPERNEAARRLHDEARRARGLEVAHVGDDPLSSLPLLRHLRSGGALAMQIDRVPAGMRARRVRLFDAEGEVPEGPLRLAQASGAPVIPVFCARLGFRYYLVDAAPPIVVPRRADDAMLDAAAQQMADAMSRFLRAYPTQWFDFGERPAR
jgi:lauroyl/myristoyl acyltransferase